MFAVNNDKSIYLTRGDVAYFSVSAEDIGKGGKDFTFKPGDVVRIKVSQKKACEKVVLQKDFDVEGETDKVYITLTGKETKIGEHISKPVDYWYEIELNPLTAPQTIVGYDEDGAKTFRLFPEARDLDGVEPQEVNLDMQADTPSLRGKVASIPEAVFVRGEGQDSVEQAISDKWNGTGNNPCPQATNRGAVAMGKYTQATGKEAMAINYSTKANGAKSFAANSSTEANAEYSAAFGHTSKVADTAPAGFVTGIGNHAKSQAQMITGRFNKDDNGALFIVGDGRSDTDRSNAFAVYPEVYGGEGASMRLGDNLLKHSDLAQMIFAIKNPQFERYSMGGTNTYNLVHINGIGNTVKGGSYSAVLGAGHEVNASYAVALNRNNKVTADNAFAANDNNKATNIHATAFGYENESSGICSFALGGNKNKVSGANSVVTGHMNIASGNEQFVAGVYNAEDPDAAFIVGNGANGVRSNAFVAKKDGSICVGGLRIGASDNVPVVESFADVTSLATSILQKMTLPGVYTQVVHSDLSTTGMGLLTIAAADGIDGCYSASIKLQVGEYEFLSGALDESRKGEWYGFDWHQVSATVCNDMDCIEPVHVKRIHLGSFPAVGSNGINTLITGKTLKDITIVDVSVTAQNESYAYKLPCYNNGFAVADVELQCMEDVIAVIVTPRKDLTGYKGCITVKWIEN